MSRIYLILLLLLIFSCNRINHSREEVEMAYDYALGGQYKLKKFNVEDKTETHSNSKSSFFLFMGSSNSSSSTMEYTHVRFYFENCLNEYQFMDLDISNVIVCDDHDSIDPYVEFLNYEKHQNYHSPIDYRMMYKHVKTAKIHCNKGVFETDININDLR